MYDPFASAYADEELAESTNKKVLTLFELNNMVRFNLQLSMPDCYWLKAEISELRVASNGHCYMELVQKDGASGSIIAKAKANIWRQNYTVLSDTFGRTTGQMLSAGINVLVCVTLNFHELYGYSLNVIDIDPTYTLGDLARQKQEILKQLQDDGVTELNKGLPLPRIIERVAVISSATAAGYGDFCKQLEQSGYYFKVKLFPAIMQGEQVEHSVIEALNAIISDRSRWDVVVIIRGGGAVTDLNGFNTYLLGANVAQFPLPILTGIGHERDDTIIDMMAHTRLKTPTAVAAFLVSTRDNEANVLQSLQQRMVKALSSRLQDEMRHTEVMQQRIAYGVTKQLNEQKSRFQTLSHRFEMVSSKYVSHQNERLLRLTSKLEVNAKNRISWERNLLSAYPRTIEKALGNIFIRAHQKHDLISKSLSFADPKRILAMGYSITYHNGKVVRNAQDLHTGDNLTTTLMDGTIESTVK